VRIAVTGGAGFIGSHVVDRLADAGHDVVVVDRRPPHRPDVSFRPTDLRDLARVERGVRRCDVVFHLAAVADVNDAFQRPTDAVAVNVAGTANVWEASVRAGVARVVLASTVWVYGAAAGSDDDAEPVGEDALIAVARAGHLYTATKLAAEMVAHSYRELYGQAFTILRYGIPFGPRMRDELVIARFVRRALDGQLITIHGDGSQFRKYVYVEDLANAHLLALSDAAENETFNLEGPERVSVKRVVEAVQAALGGHVGCEFVPARNGDYAGREVSAEKARRVLGWEATTPFEEGVRRYVEWLLGDPSGWDREPARAGT
jgi:UDP-glucose 4-epimerase